MVPVLRHLRLSGALGGLVQQQLQHAAAAAGACGASVTAGGAAQHYSAQPAFADEDELVSKASAALEDIKQAGTWKVERQITTPQAASIGALCA
jgi:hypothetical protein